MRSVLATSIVVLASLFATGAIAAEPIPPAAVVVPAVPAVPVEPVFSWAGAYVGVQGGYSWNDAASSPPAPPATLNIDGAALGLYGGLNFQADSFVFGVDGTVNYSFAFGDASPPFPPGSEATIDWTTLLRGRAGFTVDQFLIYGTAGLAGANINATLGGLGSDSVFAWGWTVGGGVEMAITDSVIGRIDYSFADYDFTLDGFAPAVSGTLQSHTLMGGFAIKY